MNEIFAVLLQEQTRYRIDSQFTLKGMQVYNKQKWHVVTLYMYDTVVYKQYLCVIKQNKYDYIAPPLDRDIHIRVVQNCYCASYNVMYANTLGCYHPSNVFFILRRNIYCLVTDVNYHIL